MAEKLRNFNTVPQFQDNHQNFSECSHDFHLILFQVSFVDSSAGTFFTNPEGDIVFELIDEQAGKPDDILNEIKLKDEPIEPSPPKEVLAPENNTMPNLTTPFLPTNQQQQQHMGYAINNGKGIGQFMNDMKSAYVTIVEQPSANKHRFR